MSKRKRKQRTLFSRIKFFGDNKNKTMITKIYGIEQKQSLGQSS